jgi:YHS domain-containing protein
MGDPFMIAHRWWGASLVALVAIAATVYAADEVKLEGVKCVVNARAAAKAANAVDYKGGKVYFCCMMCPKAFTADTAKFASKGNHQLVATGQAKQEKCPFSGQAVNPDTQIKVEGAEVAFCCDMCKGKAEASDEKIELIFNDAAFAKGFKVEKKSE